MMLKMGPILRLHRVSGDGSAWSLGVLVVSDENPGPLRFDGAGDGSSDPEELWTGRRLFAWRYLIGAELSEEVRTLRYEVAGEVFRVALPAAGHPPRMAYASCNGFSSLKAMKGINDKNALWKHMTRAHRKQPLNLLMMGGDQVYADSLWEALPSMRDWAALGFAGGNAAQATASMKRDLEEFYFDLYVTRWSQPELRQVLASVPTIMMWDDHDLVDGWGSYPPERQNSPVFQQAIWPAAERAFRTFQLQLAPGEPSLATIGQGSGFSFGHVIGGTAIMALDMRSERRLDRVLSPEHWDRVFRWIESLPAVEHLILMSSIPVVYPGFDTLEKLLGLWPGQHELEDDLADHWTNRAHKGERLRLIHRLLRLAEEGLVRPTLISGDVHVAALGYIESTRSGPGRGSVINQLISSAIVHPSPPGAVVFALRHLFDSTDEIDRGIIGRMADFPGTQVRFVGKRNYLTIDPDSSANDYRLWVNWWAEGEEQPFVKVIHPLERKARSGTVAPQLPPDIDTAD